MKNIAVFASGNGSNLQAIIDVIKRGKLKVNLALVISDNKDAFALVRAQKAGVKSIFINPKNFVSKEEFEKEIIKYLKQEKIDLIVLAGFMRILSKHFVRLYKNKILNIHPALLPSFKGSYGIKDAFNYGVKITGVTVHFVDSKMDHGPIVLQEAVKINKTDTLKSLEEKIHEIEHKIYPKAIKLFSLGKIRLKARRTVIF
ncbi:MAG: phosphoribosylglycinamide formyltransferase [Candidatus Omnitrophota bacterium]